MPKSQAAFHVALIKGLYTTFKRGSHDDYDIDV